MSFRISPILAAVIFLVGILFSFPAQAWVEQKVLAHDARVELKRSGTAHVEHWVKFRVRGGPLRTFDILVADQDVGLIDEATFVRTGGQMGARMPIPVTVEQRPDGPLRVDIDGRNGVRRGTYELKVRYEVDLLKQSAITRDGSMLLLSWVGPKWSDGIDSVKTTFVVPASPTEPRAVGEVKLDGPDEGSITAPLGSFMTTLTRLPEFDELELIRPHVARGESVTWKVRVDPSAIGEVNDPRLTPPPSPEPVFLSTQKRARYLGIGGALAVLFSMLLAFKHQQVARSCRVRGVVARPFIPVGLAVRVALAGPLLAASIAAQIFLEHPLPGAVGMVVVVLLTAYRTPTKNKSPRGPGRWLPLSDADAFNVKENWPYGWLDAGSALGKALLALMMMGAGVGIFFLSKHSVYFAYVAGLDLVVVVTLFGTGRRTELPADPVRSAAPRLLSMAKTLRKTKRIGEARICGVGRIPTGSANADELRLLVRPKGTLRGFATIEIGFGWAHGAGGSIPMPQVLLRVIEGSPCHEAVNQRLRRTRWLQGRESYERVLVVNPAIPTEDMVIKLVESLIHIVRKAPEVRKEVEKKVRLSKATRRCPKPRRAIPSNRRRMGGRRTPAPAVVQQPELRF